MLVSCYAMRVSNQEPSRRRSELRSSEFRGYEDWQVVAVNQTDQLMAAILANPAMIEAYRAGVPGNGKPFPDGSRIAKIRWKSKKSANQQNLSSPFRKNILIYRSCKSP